MRTGTVVPGFVAVTIADELVTVPDRLAVVGHDHVAGLESGARGGAARHHVQHDGAVAILQAELVDRVRGDRADADADAAARDLAGAQLRQQLADDVDRDREADADVALLLRAADDRGVDADDFAAHVQQRSARVARVDGRVGLQHLRPGGPRTPGTAARRR